MARLDVVTAVTLRGFTDDETLTFIQREEGIVTAYFNNTEVCSPPIYSDLLTGVSMSAAIAEAKKLGWNTEGGPILRERKEPPPYVIPSCDGWKKLPNPKRKSTKPRSSHRTFDANFLPSPQEVQNWAKRVK